jgi:diguanylate cyclase (GGDEF)-like protein
MSQRIRRADEQISGLSDQAVRDRLTGLQNQRAFHERLEEEAARVRRYGGSFSIILVDLQGFSEINDRLGQTIGDRLLQWMGRLLSEHTRASDIPFRLKDDSFSILCPWTSAGVAASVAARLAALVAEARPPIEEEVAITIAAGSAACPDHAQEGTALYQHAQRALLAAR